MKKRRLIVIGGSAGAIRALRTILPNLPADFDAAICVALHTSPTGPGLLPAILQAAGALPACFPVDGEELVPGMIFVAPPDLHLMLGKDGKLQLGRGARENRFRPAIDPLFRSAAIVTAHETMGIILSGGMDDGVAGLAAIKAAGGLVVVQDPEDSEVAALPLDAARQVAVDRILPADRIHEAMIAFAAGKDRTPKGESMASDIDKENAYARGGETHLPEIRSLGEPSLFTCPDCHGALIRLRGEKPERFRCHTGHAFTMHTLRALAFEQAEQGLWEAMRRLEEYAALSEHAADHSRKLDDVDEEQRLRSEAAQARTSSVSVRHVAEHQFKPFSR